MSKQNYWEKLQHPKWQQRRLEILSKAGFKCQSCQSDQIQLNVHHSYYISGREPWQYPDWSLKCLCKNCHKDQHNQELEIDQEYKLEMFELIFGFLHDGEDGDDAWYIATTIAEFRSHYKSDTKEFLQKIEKFANKLLIDRIEKQNTEYNA